MLKYEVIYLYLRKSCSFNSSLWLHWHNMQQFSEKKKKINFKLQKNEFEWCKKSVKYLCWSWGTPYYQEKKKHHTIKISDADQNAYKRRAIDKHFLNQIGKWTSLFSNNSILCCNKCFLTRKFWAKYIRTNIRW